MRDFFLFLAFCASLALIAFGAVKFAYAAGRASLGAEVSLICSP